MRFNVTKNYIHYLIIYAVLSQSGKEMGCLYPRVVPGYWVFMSPAHELSGLLRLGIKLCSLARLSANFLRVK